jgi:aspartate 1-decarboxylase
MTSSLFLKSRLVEVKVTEADFQQTIPLQVDGAWLDAMGLREHEQVVLESLESGRQATAYVMAAPPRSRTLALGASLACLGQIGDRLSISAYQWVNDQDRVPQPKVIAVEPG